MQKKIALLLVVGFLVMSTVACTFSGGPNPMQNTPKGEKGGIAGFWDGLIHGFLSPFTFIASIFTDEVNFYEVNNNGNWYDLGFVLGLIILTSGASSSSSSD